MCAVSPPTSYNQLHIMVQQGHTLKLGYPSDTERPDKRRNTGRNDPFASIAKLFDSFRIQMIIVTEISSCGVRRVGCSLVRYQDEIDLLQLIKRTW
jgi:hypothetical protein